MSDEYEMLRFFYAVLLLGKLESVPGADPVLIDAIDRVLGLDAQASKRLQAEQAHKAQVSIEGVRDSVAEHFGISPEELVSSKRTERIVTARHIAMRISRQLTHATYQQIGEVFNRDHATVMHACEMAASMAIEDVMETVRGHLRVVKA